MENTEKLAGVVCFVCVKYRLRFGMKQKCENCKKAAESKNKHAVDTYKYALAGAVLKKEIKND